MRVSSSPLPPVLARVLLVAVAGVLALTAARSQDDVQYDARAEAAFSAALMGYRDRSYRAAERAFDSLAQAYPESHRITAALIMRAKALFLLDENYEATKAVRSFLTAYPASRYVPDAELLLARIYLRIDRAQEARDAAFRAWRALPEQPPPRLQREVLATVDTTLTRGLELSALYTLLSRNTSRRERAHLWTVAAQREFSRGNTGGATAALDTLTTRYADVVSGETVERIRTGRSGAVVKLGLLLPLLLKSADSPIKEVGNEVHDGILAAYDRFLARGRPQVRVMLETRDTDREGGPTMDMARQLAADPGLIGIVGPVFSATTSAAARIAAADRIPLVSPTANQNGIAALGETIFQANPDYEQRGRAMARYAVQVLGCRVVATLAPSDTYAKFLADAFALEARSLGAVVAAQESYQKGAADLRGQLLNLRRAGFQQVAEKHLPGPASSGVVEAHADSLGLGAAGIEALYCPISSPEEIGVVSAQLVSFNIKTRLLGSGEWNNMAELEANRAYCTGVQFESDSYVDTSASSYKEFLGAFLARFKRVPGKNALFGYDTASLVLSLIGSGAGSREGLARALAGTRDYRGVHGRIGFTRGRVNTWMHVLEYTGDGIRHVGETAGEH